MGRGREITGIRLERRKLSCAIYMKSRKSHRLGIRFYNLGCLLACYSWLLLNYYNFCLSFLVFASASVRVIVIPLPLPSTSLLLCRIKTQSPPSHSLLLWVLIFILILSYHSQHFFKPMLHLFRSIRDHCSCRLRGTTPAPLIPRGYPQLPPQPAGPSSMAPRPSTPLHGLYTVPQTPSSPVILMCLMLKIEV